MTANVDEVREMHDIFLWLRCDNGQVPGEVMDSTSSARADRGGRFAQLRLLTHTR